MNVVLRAHIHSHIHTVTSLVAGCDCIVYLKTSSLSSRLAELRRRNNFCIPEREKEGKSDDNGNHTNRLFRGTLRAWMWMWWCASYELNVSMCVSKWKKDEQIHCICGVCIEMIDCNWKRAADCKVIRNSSGARQIQQKKNTHFYFGR